MPNNSQKLEPERQFGRIQSPIDNRDWELVDFIEPGYKLVKEKKWDFPSDPLDQKNSPHCVGFSMAHFGICLPTFTKYTEDDAHNFYYECKKIDGAPANEDGTTLRSAAKVMQNIGAINYYAFARDIDSIKWWLLNKGPIIMGTIWTEGMMTPDNDGVIDITGYVLGGHAYIINEWREDNYIGIQNSWGTNWGFCGRAYISKDNLSAILEYGGEALTAVELESYRGEKNGFLAWLVGIFSRIFGKAN